MWRREMFCLECGRTVTRHDVLEGAGICPHCGVSNPGGDWSGETLFKNPVSGIVLKVGVRTIRRVKTRWWKPNKVEVKDVIREPDEFLMKGMLES